MITPTQMYWLVKLDDMRYVFNNIIWLPISLACIIAFLSLCVFFAAADASDETRANVLACIKKAALWGVSMLLVAVAIQVFVAFLPSTRQMAAIIVVPKIANSEKIQLAGNKLYDLAVEWMDELRPSKGEKETKPCKH